MEEQQRTPVHVDLRAFRACCSSRRIVRGYSRECACRCVGSAARCGEARDQPSASPSGKRQQAVKKSKGYSEQNFLAESVALGTYIMDEFAFRLGHGRQNLNFFVRCHEPMPHVRGSQTSITKQIRTQQRFFRPARRTSSWAWKRQPGHPSTQLDVSCFCASRD